MNAPFSEWLRIKKVTVYKLRIPDVGGKRWCLVDLDQIRDEVEMGEVGDRFEIEVTEMTQKEIDMLPEFEGW